MTVTVEKDGLLAYEIAQLTGQIGEMTSSTRLITTEHVHAKLVGGDETPDPALSADNDGAVTVAVSLTLASGATVNEFSTDGTLAGNSDTAVPTEQAVKTYVNSAASPTAHTHDKLVASDGSPDPALSADATGIVTAADSFIVTKFLTLTDGGTLTISGGVVTATTSLHAIDTEGGAASDNLDTINGVGDGRILIIRSTATARDVVVTRAGNILLVGTTCTLGASSDRLLLIGRTSTNSWYEVARSING